MSSSPPIASAHKDGSSIVDDDEFLTTCGNANADDNGHHHHGGTRYRFIRLNPRYNADETLGLLRSELSNQNNNTKESSSTSISSSSSYYPLAVPWLDARWGFYALPPDFRLAQSECFRTGRVYGQDVSSGAAVAALLSDLDMVSIIECRNSNDINEHATRPQQQRQPLRVLDLCCAPGLKLCAMADWLSEYNSNHHSATADTTNESYQQQQQQQTQRQQQQQHPALEPSTPRLEQDVIVVGVDISQTRMAVCKRVVHKYHIDSETSCGGVLSNNDDRSRRRARIRMYCADGTTFGMQCKKKKNEDNEGDSNKPDDTLSSSLVFDSEASLDQQKDDDSSSSGRIAAVGTKRKRMNKSARARLAKRLKQVAQLDCCQFEESGDGHQGDDDDRVGERVAIKLFDRVLVDAECSTDGSLKHVQKRIQKEQHQESSSLGVTNGGEGKKESAQSDHLVRTLTNQQALDELVDLQRRLAASGFRLLKPGGFMVYSTCSLCVEQNEEVVEWLLEKHEQHARLVPVEFGPSLSSIRDRGLVKENKFGVTFLPNTSSDELCGGGFFLAKIQKMAGKNGKGGDSRTTQSK